MATSNQNPAQGFSHLHYGGSLNPKSSRLGPKPQMGITFKKQQRMELMVRLENAGISEAQAAAMLCVSMNRLKYIKRSTDYLNARIKITHGIIVDQEGAAQAAREQRKEILTSMLPPALQVLANELQQKAVTLAERRHQTSVALELLDREGSYAKISRAEIKPVDAFDFERHDEAARSVISAVKAVAPAPSMHTPEAIEANREFSNSHTLSAVEQQAALKSLEDAALTGEIDSAMLELVPPVNDKVN